jgi:hypothetical protein
MKKLLGSLLLIVLIHQLSSGQESPNQSIMTMMNEAESYIREIETTNVISKLEFGIVTGSCETPITLVGGKTYNVLVVGERNMIRNLDLVIRYKSGDDYIVADKINENTNRIRTQFKPDQTTYYYFKISVNQYYSGYDKGGYFIIVYL